MQRISDQLEQLMPHDLLGSVVETVGTTIAVGGFPAPVGSVVEIQRQSGKPLVGEVVGFRGELTLVFPLEHLNGVRQGSGVRLVRTVRSIPVGDSLLGRVVDAHGNCIDGLPQPAMTRRSPLDQDPPSATSRPRIHETFSTGVRAIDGMLTCGDGQRIGIFAGSGVGKSVTLGMMAKYASSDVNVIALIGERGREVNDFIERDLGPEGMARSVVIVATSDQPAIMRVQAAMAATSIAEYFRESGRRVLFMMDSVTRFAMAQREIGLAAGEPPTTKGYTPSVFAMLPKLVERTGRSAKGSITAFYTVLVEGDDTNEPVSDTVRGLLDGHVILSRAIAAKGHYPAIDILGSISRLMNDLVGAEFRNAAQVIRELMSIYRENEDLINIGAYRQGTNPQIDLAIRMRTEIDTFLRQAIEEKSSVAEAQQQLLQLVAKCGARPAPNAAALAKAKRQTQQAGA
ncbi:FliI/YscN family ATPase [Blastopirellula marina]|uniref:EscN/YscN/HrcN family type III secretion system ATPase n=1 Tax=Blastopirellula marina TaxID=124 RepID=A0A2S8F259_9BACT|nr:FliI/YscN family ATPase [Blastopirellula marina]PQO26265.1 EscN/YscN/HrcN family type III secretion system ATPase [Blastopirellula marina]PTL40665.1 FliI/YscN family ATPase [Blastopirellula marina]